MFSQLAALRTTHFTARNLCADGYERNFFDTMMGAISLRTLFAGTKRSHGRSNCKFDAALGLLNLWQEATGLPLGSPRRRWAGEKQAHVAQLVEHVLGKDEVTGSIPVMGSKELATGSGELEEKTKFN